VGIHIKENNNFMLNDQQELALKQCVAAYSERASVFGLLGGGGTGKTYTASSIIRALKEQSSPATIFKVLLLAPTNSALKSLKRAISHDLIDKNFEFKTLHSALKKQPDISDTGKIIFSGTSSEEDFRDCSVIFIDEASMVGLVLAKELLEIVEITGTFLIICGDKYQHYPVKEETSFLIEIALKSRHQELTQIMRQTSTVLSEPIQICRDSVINKEKGFDPRWTFSETMTELIDDKVMGYYILENNVMRQIWRAYSKAYHENNFDFCKVIAARNNTVDGLNQEIRLAIWGEDIEEYVVDDLLLVKRPVMVDVMNTYTNKYVSVAILQTGAEVIVQKSVKNLFTFFGDVDPKTRRPFEYSFVGWTLTVKEIGTVITATVSLLANDSKKDYNDLLEKFKAKAKRKVKESQAKNQSAKGLWADYYKLVNFFEDVKYGYACTSHYVQGKTYTNVFIAADDIASITSDESKNRGFYVALSRAKEKIIII
jgi:ATP-dependent exoDNAse (exonuclease V) alpha subunit